MRVIKKINNNVVLAINDNEEEIFVVGKGLGFMKTPYNLENSSEKIEKIFVQNENLKFNMLFKSIPSDVILVAEEIISQGREYLGVNLNDTMLIALSDHINTALNRYEDGEEVINSYQWEMKHIYPTEAALGFKSLSIIKEKLGVELPESEASFIALHFVNGQLNSNDFTETAKINKIMKDILNIIKYHYQVNIDEQSINYARFVTHIRYFLLRLMNNESLNQDNGDVFEIIKSGAKKELDCIDKIDKYLKDNYNWDFPKNEKLYLILHLQRVMRNL
ncbi:PRD domain-containing protein [Priestia endophytica]|uniref:PRD domain-containing protein n=1 Tax=Priestia endophytica TaxID=135735 RepID=UPI000F9D9B63|nr:PRD domain-containing protein [Priestia endophytica]RPK03078.1 hypothetical protein FH5_02154 [Priestia endophytica]